MRAIDTNVLVRLIVRDDPRQTAAAESFTAKGAWVSLVVLAETTWVLGSVYDRGSEEIAAAMDMLLDHQHLVVEEPDVVAAAVDILRRRAKLTFSDCLVVATARKAGHLPLGTFDHDLSKVEHVERL